MRKQAYICKKAYIRKGKSKEFNVNTSVEELKKMDDDAKRALLVYGWIGVKCGKPTIPNTLSVTDERVKELDGGWYQYSVKIKVE